MKKKGLRRWGGNCCKKKGGDTISKKKDTMRGRRNEPRSKALYTAYIAIISRI